MPKHSYVGAMEGVKELNQDAYLSTSLQNLLTDVHYLNVLAKVTFYLINVNNCAASFKKVLANLGQVLLI